MWYYYERTITESCFSLIFVSSWYVLYVVTKNRFIHLDLAQRKHHCQSFPKTWNSACDHLADVEEELSSLVSAEEYEMVAITSKKWGGSRKWAKSICKSIKCVAEVKSKICSKDEPNLGPLTISCHSTCVQAISSTGPFHGQHSSQVCPLFS